MAEIPCATCGKLVHIPNCHINRQKYIFCSKECRGILIVSIVCVVCGKTFYSRAQNAGRAKYCSKKCFQRFNRDNETHKKGKLETIICQGCGIEFRIRHSVAKTQKYCSKECGGIYGSHPTGIKNHKWKPKIKLICQYCGKQFETFPCRAGRRNYCSKKHATLGNLQRFASGKRTDIEIAMADALKKAKIEFAEQVILFDKFMVDFLLTDRRIVIQCDGLFWHSPKNVQSRDRGQDKYLNKAGYEVLRFTDKEIYRDLSACIEKINNAIIISPPVLL
jgi:very-short-patch-repair endonuclease